MFISREQYYSYNFLCTECEEWRNRYHDEYPCFGEEPGQNVCIDCFHNKRSQFRQRDYHLMVHYKYSIVGMTVKQARAAAKRAFELHEWYGGEIFGRKYIPRHITHRY